MKINYTAIGVFVFSAILLFGFGLFLIGNSHNVFSHHIDILTELTDVNGISPGTKVKVSGFDAGQVTRIKVPEGPSGKFTLKLHIDDKLQKLIREDSFVTVESDGLVGDKFLLIHDGSEQSQQAPAGAMLRGEEPIEFSAVLAKATGVMEQAKATMGDIRTRADGALDAVTTTVNNANGIVTGIRAGKGTVGMLLSDEQTAGSVKAAVGNAQQATANLNQLSVQAKQVMTDVQSRNLPQKAEDTLNNAKEATSNLDQSAQKIHATLDDALGPDRSGNDAAENIRETLSNVNLATANLADDAEALKHEFFFRGFFKKRGFYSLRDLSPEQYRTNPYLEKQKTKRAWLNATDTFAKGANGNEVLSPSGERQIDRIIGAAKDSVVDQPIIVEGYSNQPSAAGEMAASRSRTILLARYLEKRFHFNARNIGLMPLNATAPPSSGKDSWDGACIVLLAAAE
jgi:phospholipid/cholesterol/gamma-HCH transport system substrate-binding protein